MSSPATTDPPDPAFPLTHEEFLDTEKSTSEVDDDPCDLRASILGACALGSQMFVDELCQETSGKQKNSKVKNGDVKDEDLEDQDNKSRTENAKTSQRRRSGRIIAKESKKQDIAKKKMLRQLL